ncbi:hypothetical protein IID27_03070 [Patescibacteria group bacterium]|nr:hypothetical protein [Patescibacteria group bacterium]
MDTLIQLEAHCTFEKDQFGSEEAYVLTFQFGRVTTTIRIVLDDYSGADLVITNMTTLPENQSRKSYGSKALRTLLQWALDNNLDNILAVQVQKDSEIFWVKNGFLRLKNETNDFVYQGIT